MAFFLKLAPYPINIKGFTSQGMIKTSKERSNGKLQRFKMFQLFIIIILCVVFLVINTKKKKYLMQFKIKPIWGLYIAKYMHYINNHFYAK